MSGNLQDLLKWSIAQQGGDEEAKKRAGKPDPRALAQLFGMMQGKDDPTLMKECCSVLEDSKSTNDDKQKALTNLEMLIENIDNANNLENMKLWQPILKQVQSDDPQLQALACSCIGSAVQNNPKAQKDFLAEDKDGSIYQKILNLADTSSSSQLKALYALSSIVRHNPPAYKKFEDSNGWKLIPTILHDSSSSDRVKLRVLSLLSSLLSDEKNLSSKESIKKVTKIREDQVVESIIELLDEKKSLNCIDRAINLLAFLISHGYKFNENEITNLTSKVNGLHSMVDRLNEDDYKILKSVLN